MDCLISLTLPGRREREKLIVRGIRDLMTPLLSDQHSRDLHLLLAQQTEASVVSTPALVHTAADTDSYLGATTAISAKAAVARGQVKSPRGFRKPKVSEVGPGTSYDFSYNHPLSLSEVDSPVRDHNSGQAIETVMVVARRGGTRASTRGGGVKSDLSAALAPPPSSTTTAVSSEHIDFARGEDLDIRQCVASLADNSEGWTGRDINKLMNNILSHVLATEQ
jgi:hypothetical protein